MAVCAMAAMKDAAKINMEIMSDNTFL